MPAHTLLIATTNPGKIAEMRTLLTAFPPLSEVTLITPRELGYPLPEVEETGTTFAENARLKASVLARASSLVALADDSGLCVDALGGDPGIHSARWAGPTDADRNQALLERMAASPVTQRSARFVCAVCAATPDGQFLEAEGFCNGSIDMAPRGSAGFGYDPIFFLPRYGRSFAELTPDEKGLVSHRARALAILVPQLSIWLGTTGQKNR